ncbi:MAG: hypothetical protein EJNHJLOP_00013 [Methanophagales virus PBV082]|uniref:Uncharacterized protein n=1 Tax=Methanophagales virus PBV082 TaxID=3071307 RepID=A0AA46TDX4_9VIRU|nr:MAG: hypothetical protein QIT52_gp13 [Methanophagales virus PBV082]UYL64902.1 MAG: hypothetical protein EJNHJLOP_00013 [Methanophagales virus PBV082]
MSEKRGIGFVSAILILMFVVVAVFTLSIAWSEIPVEPQATTSIANTSTIIPTLTSFLPYLALVVIVAMAIGIFLALVRE